MDKAIILVAGMGTRLKPRTIYTHKCLTKVNDTPILKNALNNLNKAGIKSTILVIGYLGDKIRDEIGDNYQGMKIIYVINDKYTETNTSFSLKLGLDNIGGYKKLYLLEGDVFFEYGLLDKLIQDNHEAATLIEKYSPELDGTFIELSDRNYVVDWTHKSMREEGYILDDKYKTINIHKFSKEFIDNILTKCVIEMCNRTEGKAPLENIMREIVHNDNKCIYGLKADGYKWFEIDDEKDLAVAERLFGDSV